MDADHLPEVTRRRSAATRRILTTAVALGAAAGIAACGSSSSPAAGSGQISGRVAPGDRAVNPGHYALGIPANLKQVSPVHGSTGRVVNAWYDGSSIAVEGTWDPHPQTTVDSAVSAVRSGAAASFRNTQVSVQNVTLPGARSARLVTASGTHSGTAAANTTLVAVTPAGAMLELSVVTLGSGTGDTSGIIDSVKLTN